MIHLLLFLLFNSNLGSVNSSYALNIINNTYLYIETINESGYLIFYPNLSQSYSLLNKAKEIVNQSPSVAIDLANEAKASADNAYQKIQSYKYASFLVVLILLFIFSYLLYKTIK